MRSIENFKNCKIENLQDIYGGQEVRDSNVDITTGKGTDKIHIKTNKL